MKKIILLVFIAVLLLALTACGGPKSDVTTPNVEAAPKVESSTTTEAVPANGQEKTAQTFSIEPVVGWELDKNSATETFKTYIIFEPYVGAASFYFKYFSDDILDGRDNALEQTFKDEGMEVNKEKIIVGNYQAVRYILSSNDELIQMQALYYINVEGGQDIFCQLVAPNDKFTKAQSAWEEALNTIKLAY